MDYANVFIIAMSASLVMILVSVIIGIFRLNRDAVMDFGPTGLVLMIFGSLAVVIFVVAAFAGVLVLTIGQTTGSY